MELLGNVKYMTALSCTLSCQPSAVNYAELTLTLILGSYSAYLMVYFTPFEYIKQYSNTVRDEDSHCCLFTLKTFR